MRFQIIFTLILGALLSLLMAMGSNRPSSEAALVAPSALRSSPITITPNGQQLAVINPDSNSFSLIDRSSLTLLLEIPVGPNPQTVTIEPSGRWAFVTNKDDDTLSVVDLEAGELITNLPVGDEPFGVVVGQGGRVYVANTGSGTVQIIDQSTWDTLATIPVETGPRGLALSLDERSLYVTHFQSGKLSIINTDTFNVEAVISTGPDSNVSQSILLDPASELAYLPHTRSNATNQALLFDTTVFPVVSVVDLSTGEHLRSKRIFLDIVDTPVNLPLDAALTSSGKLYVVNAGSNDISVIDLNTRSAVAHLEVGDNPRGLVLSPDEKTLYVSNTLRGTVSIIDTLTDQVVGEIVVTQIPLPPDLLNGKILFNTSARADMAKDQWISCATCHFDAKMDGRTWFTKDGPRNTPNLSGVKDTLPIHWSGDLDELQDVEATIRNRQAGTGLASGPLNCDPACDQGPPNAGRSKDLDDLAVYMRALTFGPNPNLTPDGTLTASAERGRVVFLSDQTGCASCHVPPLYTDLQKHDVGTGVSPLETKGTNFDTPSLRGVYQTAPYLHDGSAETLLEVLTANNPGDLHGQTSQLTSVQLQDLVQFLLALPYQIPEEEVIYVANFMNGNDAALNSRVYLFNPTQTAGEVTVRVFTLPLVGGTAQELTITPLGLGTLGARSALNIKLAEDILRPLGITLPYTADGGDLTLEFTIQAADVRAAAQVFSSSFAFGTYALQKIPATSSGSPTVLVANFMNGNDAMFNSRVYLWNPSTGSGDVTVRVFTLPVSGGLAQELTAAPVNLGTLKARSALNIKVAEDILTALGIITPYMTDGGNLTLEFTIQAADVRGTSQVFSPGFGLGTNPLQEIPATSSGSPTLLVANFVNGNNDAFNSRVYLWNPSDSAGNVTVRVFTLPLTGGTAQELTTTPLFLGTLGAKSALNLKLAEDILTPLGIITPYMTDGGNLTLEFTIQAADVRGTAQVFSSSFGSGTNPLQEIPSASSGSPTVLVATILNGNNDAFNSRVYLWNPSDSAGNVTVRVFTLPLTGGLAQELTTTPLALGSLGARSALNIKLAEDILTPLGILLPYITDGGNLILEFTVEAADVRGAAQVFSDSFGFGTYPLEVIQ